jgi:hypothetical protein
MNDMLSLGAVAMTAGSEDIASRVLKGAAHGGFISTKTRRKKQKEWQDQVIAEAKEIAAKNPRLTQDDMAAKVQERWLPFWPRLPGRNLIIACLSAAQADGRLPKRPK